MRENEIHEMLKKSMKERDSLKVSVYRMLIAEIKNKKIADRTGELKEEEVIQVVKKMVKRHKDSVELFIKGNRMDLAEKEKNEQAVLEEMLPEEMPREEVEGIVSAVIGEAGAAGMQDMGKIMGKVMERVKGRADGKIISQIVREKLV